MAQEDRELGPWGTGQHLGPRASGRAMMVQVLSCPRGATPKDAGEAGRSEGAAV